MVEMNIFDPSLLTEAMMVWTGWGRDFKPRRDDSSLGMHFGPDIAVKLLPILKALEDDFYSSDARFVAVDVREMEKMSSEQFAKRHPEISSEIVKALAWCYTFDFK